MNTVVSRVEAAEEDWKVEALLLGLRMKRRATTVGLVTEEGFSLR